MSTTTKTQFASAVAACVAGEDVRPGDYLTILNETFELPSYLWCSSGGVLPADEPVRCRYIASDAGKPFKVTAVCLRFIYAKSPQSEVEIFDVRRQQLVRLDRVSAKTVWQEMRGKKPKKKRRKRK